MKLRLIIPKCTNWNGWYCCDADDIESRLSILKDSMKDNSVNLIITSHNFFSFFPHCLINHKRIVKKLIKKLHKSIDEGVRKPIIVGLDLLTPNKKFNPFKSGINAIVYFIGKNNENKYQYITHIWQCWEGKQKCCKACFQKQNQSRVIKFYSKKIGLLSCGDIASCCHNNGNLLPNVDIYVDLSHKSLRGLTSQNRISPKIINHWQKANVVLVTQQVNNVRSYIKNQSYPYIFSNPGVRISTKVSLYKINNKTGAYVDVEIH